MLLKSRIVLFFLISFQIVFCYSSPEEFISDDENSLGEDYYSQILENLKQSPINLNKASYQELEELFWLSSEQISILWNLQNKGEIKSYKQLIKAGFSKKNVEELKPYITFEIIKNYDLTLQSRIYSKEVDQSKNSPLNIYQRVKGNFNKFKFCFLHQKDPEEKRLLNFYSYYLEYYSDDYLQKILIGKYRLEFGQGLLFASKLGLSKGTASTSIPFKKYNSLKGYTSSYEIWALEGVAFVFKYKHFFFTPFYSDTKLKANLNNNKISSFNKSGIDISDSSGNVSEQIYGANIAFLRTETKLGITFAKFAFDKQFDDNKYPSKYSGLSSYFNTRINEIEFFGEIASIDEKFAGVSGIRWGDQRIKQLLLFRKYPDHLINWHANSFTSASMKNETGIYYGLKIIPRIRTKINFYIDIWKYPKVRYFEKMPTTGNEEFLQFETFSKFRKIAITLKHKNKEKYKTIDDESIIRDFEQTLLRIDWWSYYDLMKIKTRFEFANEYLPENKLFKNGILIYEQVKFIYKSLEIVGQITVFHSQILHYMYEYALDGTMETSVFSGDGVHTYLLLKYDWNKTFETQFKISDRWNENNCFKIGFQFILKL
ncbi:MAG: helix-hairpin-helix domain-containing protein [Candidatus Cloacimonetes bacterium]|nr:helix-hairpin-helix domain-containing protein [Candidatus Cloacimonadota bacterium]